MNGVKALNRQGEPLAVKMIHPVMCQCEKQKPQKQNPVVDKCTPAQNTTD